MNTWVYDGIVKNAYSGSIGPGAYRTFSVTGEGKVIAIPDIATFSYGVHTEGGAELGKLQVENTLKINQVLKFLKSQGVEEKDIKTTSYSIQPQYEYTKILGYTIYQTVAVKMRDFAKIGGIIRGLYSNIGKTRLASY